MTSRELRSVDRFIVFGYREFYPVGGLNDVLDSFPTEKEAIKFAEDKMSQRGTFRLSCCHILDCDKKTEVWRKQMEV